MLLSSAETFEASLKKCVDPDQTAPVYLGLHCLPQ